MSSWPEDVWWQPVRPTFTMQGYNLICDEVLERIGCEVALDPEGNQRQIPQLLEHIQSCRTESRRLLFLTTYQGYSNEVYATLSRQSHYFHYLARYASEELKCRTRGMYGE